MKTINIKKVIRVIKEYSKFFEELLPSDKIGDIDKSYIRGIKDASYKAIQIIEDNIQEQEDKIRKEVCEDMFNGILNELQKNTCEYEETKK